jgi:ribosomal protein L7Ae-like RNA K-turn-binding protein
MPPLVEVESPRQYPVQYVYISTETELGMACMIGKDAKWKIMH